MKTDSAENETSMGLRRTASSRYVPSESLYPLLKYTGSTHSMPAGTPSPSRKRVPKRKVVPMVEPPYYSETSSDDSASDGPPDKEYFSSYRE
jgi:hypothetical protein